MNLGDRQPFRREALFGGRGAVRVWDLLGARAAPPFAAVLACELEAGANVGRHVQQQFPEVVVCLEGKGVARIDGCPFPLEPGAVVHLPLGSTLEIDNRSSDASLWYLIVKAGEQVPAK